MNIINMLENIKLDKYEDYRKHLSEDDVVSIQKWHSTFSKDKNEDIDKIISLLYHLYFHENLNFYPMERFCHIANELTVSYKLVDNSFPDIMQGFNVLLYNS